VSSRIPNFESSKFCGGEATMSVWTLSHKIIVIVHGERPPTDQELDRLIADLHRWAGNCEGILVIAGQVAPNATQRQRLNDDALMRAQRVAVLSDAPMARGSITAMHWLGKSSIQGFATADIKGALNYLRVPLSARAAIVATAARLKAALHGISIDELAKTGMGEEALDAFVVRESPSALRMMARKQVNQG
jgi:hypothetical protein